MDGAKGNISFCTGKDTSGSKTAGVKAFNTANPGDHGQAFAEFPEPADEPRNQFVQRQEAKSSDCDVFYSDVIWTAEFAQQKWLYDMTPYVESRKDEFIPSTLRDDHVPGQAAGHPAQDQRGLPLLPHGPGRQGAGDVAGAQRSQAAKEDGLAYQGELYEGLTVNFLELAFAAGGQVLSEDGAEARVDSPENLKALKFMVDGIKDGAAPKSVTTYMEEPARRAFESGKATFMRNWPYCFALAPEGRRDEGQVRGRTAAGVRGGREGRHPRRRQPRHLHLLEEPGRGAEVHRLHDARGAPVRGRRKFSDASPLKSIYEDPAVQKAQPFSDELKAAIEQAKSRPVSPVYPQISAALYKNVNQALSGAKSPEDALKAAQSDMEKALKTF